MAHNTALLVIMFFLRYQQNYNFCRMNSFKKLTGGLERKYVLTSLSAPFVMVGEVLMETLIPLIMARIIDVGIAEKNTAYVLKTGLLMIAASCFSLLCGASCGRLSSVAALGFSRNLRRKLFKKVQSFSFSAMDKFGTGSLVTRLTTDVTNLQNMYQNLIRSMVRSPLMLISGTVMACFINARLALIFFITIPFLAAVLAFISARAYPRFQVMFKKYDWLNTIVQENLIAIRVVKSFVREEHEKEKFDLTAEQLRDSQIKAEKLVIWNAPIMQLTIYLCIVAALWFGGNMILSGTMKTGELVSFITYITQILSSLMMLSMMFVQMILSRTSISRILEVLDEVPDIESPKSACKTVADGSIDFDNVFFSYEKKESNCVLQNVSVHIKSGQTVGILGGTGSSKTTFVSLIPRLYDVLSGSIKVGGIDVRDYDIETLRRSIGFVLQKSLLFSGTIKENLRWGSESASDSDLRKACEIAAIDDFVGSLPGGFDTDLGQGGVNLSGGQKQRLCIARALLKKPAILILDDSTSAVDTATDKRIREALRQTLPQTTKLIIAQRISSVQDSDFIIVFDDGKINAIGTHESLMKSNKIYKEVYNSQMSME